MTVTHPSLYSLDSLGNIREWFCEVEGARFRMVAGIHGGAMVRSADTIAEPKNIGKKNETSPEEQAILEVEALYKKKLKTKYFKTIEAAHGEKNYFEPMLAKVFEDYKDKIQYPVNVQCKFNGSRLILKKDGAFTRKGERYFSIPHIIEAFKPFFEKYPDAILDGELFNEDLRERLNELIKLVRRSVNVTAEDLEKSKQMVSYYVYDGFGFGANKEDDYFIRWSHICEKLKDIPYFVKVDTFLANSEAMIQHHFLKYIARGHEGIMVRIPNAPYKNGRSKDLLKYKPVFDSEGKVKAINTADGNWAGKAKTATLEWNGIEFDASFKGSMQTLEKIWQNKHEWIGKEVTFEYYGLTGLGTPNFVQIDPSNCFKS